MPASVALLFSFQMNVCSPFFSLAHICLLTSFLSGPLVVHHTNMLVSRSRLVEKHQLSELTIISFIVNIFSSPRLHPSTTGVSSPGTASQLPCVSGGAHTAGRNCL